MSNRASSGLKIGAVVVATLLTATAQADYELYNANDTKINLQLTLVGAQFGQNHPWWGEEHSFLNVSATHWTEFGTKFGASFESKLWGGTLFGQGSGVYTSQSGDDASGLTAGLSDESQTTWEQSTLGWKTDDRWTGLDKSTISVQLGRFDYSIGTGMIINDGGSDGGDRGGWYIGMRKSFQNGALIRLDSTDLKAQLFRVKNNPRRGGVQGEARGVNADYTVGASGVTLGGTVMRVYREGSSEDIDVYDGRASWTALPGLTFSGEYAYEDGSNDGISGKGYYAQGRYEFSNVPWKPSLTYRYALFNDEFNTLAYGYTDYGYWFQGEIAGNYPLYNNNLKSNMLRVNAKPTEAITLNLFYYDFKLDDPKTFSGVSSDDFGDEVDFTVDWQATDRIYVITVLGDLMPGAAAKEWVGATKDKDWLYAMFYVSFTL